MPSQSPSVQCCGERVGFVPYGMELGNRNALSEPQLSQECGVKFHALRRDRLSAKQTVLTSFERVAAADVLCHLCFDTT